MAGNTLSYPAWDADLMVLAIDGGGSMDALCATSLNSAAIGENISGITANVFLTVTNSTANPSLSAAAVTDTTLRNAQMASSLWHQSPDSQILVARFDTNSNSYIDVQDIMRAVAQQGRTCP